MELLADRFAQRAKEAKTWKSSNPNKVDGEGKLVVEKFDKEKYKEWAREQIKYLQVRPFLHLRRIKGYNYLTKTDLLTQVTMDEIV